VDAFTDPAEAATPPTIEAQRNELRRWAQDRLNRANAGDGNVPRYVCFGTDWFGVLQKCYWQTEQLLKRIVNQFLAIPSVASQSNICRITKGSKSVELTFTQ
jgi:hypothetical protein